MGSEQRFGGDWTIEKLDIFIQYLDAYLTALKYQKFGKIYIDAFAGTGSITTRDGSQEISGSARLALSSKIKFDAYYFIEADKFKAGRLESMVKEEFPEYKDRIYIRCGDANIELAKIARQIDWQANRALLFLDPYATQVAWSTLETVAKTGSVDVWYLFPFQALQRMLRKDGQMEQSWIDCINRLLGDSSWATSFYEENPQISLFVDSAIIKSASTVDVEKYIIQRLKQIFPAVAPKPKIFYNRKNSPIFLFCFAAASNSRAAQRLALNIAGHILGNERQKDAVIY